MGKWTEDLGKELAFFLNRLAKEPNGEKENKEKKKPFTIREIGLPRLIVILVAGLALLILTFPDFFSAADNDSEKKAFSLKDDLVTQKEEVTLGSDVDTYIENAEKRLEMLLKKVDGVGNVEVMITVKSSGESIPLKDTPYEKSSTVSEEESGSKKTEQEEKSEEGTVMIENSDGTTQPYVVRETVPEIEGVVVIAQGGGNSEIKKEIVEAVQVLFDIKAHKIKVMKMS